MIAAPPITIPSPTQAREASRRFPRRNEAAIPRTMTVVRYGIRRPATNDSPKASSQYAAGAANGNCRRTKSGSTMITIAGTANQSVTLRRLRRATFEGEFEHGSNRHEHDQRIETVRAHEQPEAPHAVNVLHALARHLLPQKDSKIIGWEEDKSGLRTTRRRDHHSERRGID